MPYAWEQDLKYSLFSFLRENLEEKKNLGKKFFLERQLSPFHSCILAFKSSVGYLHKIRGAQSK